MPISDKDCHTIIEGSMQENLLSADQVARYLRVDKFTVYRLVSQKKIPAFKVGNQWRFKRRMIDAWLLKNSNLAKSGRD
jgi:excisionase family DNA binding protein